jgi:hypothetical protein
MMRSIRVFRRVTSAMVMLIISGSYVESATELSEGEAQLLLDTPEFSVLLPSRPIEQFDTMRTKRADVLGLMREGTPIPYSWTNDPSMCGSVGRPCVLVGPDGIDPRCRSSIHSAALIATQSNEFYATLLNVYSFEPAIGHVNSIRTEGGRTVVELTTRWEPASLYYIILEEIGDLGRIDRDRATNPWLQSQTLRVFFHYYDEFKPEKEWLGWRIVGARPY